MKPHIRLHYWPSGRYIAEMRLSWTPSYMAGASWTARGALEAIREAVWSGGRL
jgi:hypothetical protein